MSPAIKGYYPFMSTLRPLSQSCGTKPKSCDIIKVEIKDNQGNQPILPDGEQEQTALCIRPCFI